MHILITNMGCQMLNIWSFDEDFMKILSFV